MREPSSPWLTAREAATRAKCGPRLIYRAVAAGQLRAARIGAGRAVRIHIDWVDEWLRWVAGREEVSRAS